MDNDGDFVQYSFALGSLPFLRGHLPLLLKLIKVGSDELISEFVLSVI